MGWPVVVNSNGAKTKGIELEINGRIIDHLTYTAGYSHTDATLSRDFTIQAHFGSFGGEAGQTLPGSPLNSFSGSLSYDVPLGTYDAQVTANVSHKGAMTTALPDFHVQRRSPGDTH